MYLSRGVSGYKVISTMSANRRRLDAVLWCVLFLLVVGLFAGLSTTTIYAATQPSVTPNLSSDGPVPSGQETLWVNVTRWWRGKPCEPTTKLLRSIINSYRSGKWTSVGSPIKDLDNLWWQKLVRPRYISVVYMPFYFDAQGCQIRTDTNQPFDYEYLICACWTNWADFFIGLGYTQSSCR